MEEISTKNEEEENVPRRSIRLSRRYSILKQTKSVEDDDVTISAKPPRRVSFASSNFVKPFAADSDKNTIWDTTYEEEVNGTDSTRSSQEQTSDNTNTLYLHTTTNSNINGTNLCETEMDFTEILTQNKENIPTVPNKVSIVDFARKKSLQVPSNLTIFDKDESMEFTCQIQQSSAVTIEKSFYGYVFEESLNGSEKMEVEVDQNMKNQMELTENVKMKTGINEDFSIKDEKAQNLPNTASDMDISYQTPFKSESLKHLKREEDMTCQISSKLENTGNLVHDICNVEQSSHISCENEIQELMATSGNMEFTGDIPIKLENEKNFERLVEDTENVDENCQISFKNIEKIDEVQNLMETTCNMAFTCQFPLKLNNQYIEKLNEEAGNMEKKCQISLAVEDNENLKKNDGIEELMATSGNMEFTGEIPIKLENEKHFERLVEDTENVEQNCQISFKNIEKIDEVQNLMETTCNMEFTCQFPLKLNNTQYIEKLNEEAGNMEKKCQISLAVEDNENFKKNEGIEELMATSGNMEFTGEIPIKLENEKNFERLVEDTENVEENCQISFKNIEKIDEVQNLMETTCNMEFTCQFPLKLNNNQYIEKLNEGAGNMEEKCQIPSITEDNENVKKNDEIQELMATTCNMEFTCQFPVKLENKENIRKIDNSQNLATSDMQQTYLIPFKEQNIENFATKVSNTELVCQIPSSINKSTISKNTDLTCQSLQNVVKTGMSDNKQQTTCNTSTNELKCTSDVPEIVSLAADSNINNCQVEKLSWRNINEKSIHIIPKNSEVIQSPMINKNTRRTFTKSQESNCLSLVKNCDNSIIDNNGEGNSGSQIVDIETTKANVSLNCESLSAGFKMDVNNFSKKHLQTPESSFHINLNNISSGIDDTTHLIQCSYTKTNVPSFIQNSTNSKLEKESMLLQFEQTGYVNEPLIDSTQLTQNEFAIDQNISSKENSLTDIQRNKLLTVNDTYFLKSKNDKKDDISIMQQTFNKTCDKNKLLHDTIHDFTVIPGHDLKKKLKLKEYNFTIKQCKVTEELLKDIQRQKDEIHDFLTNFEFKPCLDFKQFVVDDELAKQYDEQFFRQEENEKEMTLEQKIKALERRSHEAWKLKKVDGHKFLFSTLYGTLIFLVEVHPVCSRVIEIQLKNELSETSAATSHYIIKVFMERLGYKQIESALGQTYDVLSLLEYVEMWMMKFAELQKEWVHHPEFTIDQHFMARWIILKPELGIYFEIYADISNLEHINCNEVKIIKKLGQINEEELKRFLQNCPKGLEFFSHFSKCVDDYLKLLMKRNQFKISK